MQCLLTDAAKQWRPDDDQWVLGRNAMSIVTSLSTKMRTEVRNNKKYTDNFSSQKRNTKRIYMTFVRQANDCSNNTGLH